MNYERDDAFGFDETRISQESIVTGVLKNLYVCFSVVLF